MVALSLLSGVSAKESGDFSTALDTISRDRYRFILMDDIETWKPLVGWESFYEVCPLGRVRSLDRWARVKTVENARLVKGRVLKGAIWDGYPFLHLRGGGRSQRMALHTAVALTFLGPRPEGAEVCHNDGDRKNAAANNLRYASRKENHADMIGHGSRIFGEKHHSSKVSDKDIIYIRSADWGSKTVPDLAQKFKMSSVAIRNIRIRKTWRHVA